MFCAASMRGPKLAGVLPRPAQLPFIAMASNAATSAFMPAFPSRSVLGSGVLGYLNARELGREVLGLAGDLDCHLPRYALVHGRKLAVRVGHHGRLAAVGLLADLDVQRQRAQVIHAVLGRHALAAALAEDVLSVATFAADMHGHVLDDAQDRHTDLLEHLDALFCI